MTSDLQEINKLLQQHRALESGRVMYFWRVLGLTLLVYSVIANLFLFVIISTSSSGDFSQTMQIVFASSTLFSLLAILILGMFLAIDLAKYHTEFKQRNIIGNEMLFCLEPNEESGVIVEVYSRTESSMDFLTHRLKKQIGICLRIGGKIGLHRAPIVIASGDAKGCSEWRIEWICWDRDYRWSCIQDFQHLMLRLTDGTGRSIDLSLIEALQWLEEWSTQEKPDVSNGNWPKNVVQHGWTIDYILQRANEQLRDHPISTSAVA